MCTSGKLEKRCSIPSRRFQDKRYHLFDVDTYMFGFRLMAVTEDTSDALAMLCEE